MKPLYAIQITTVIVKNLYTKKWGSTVKMKTTTLDDYVKNANRRL